MRSGLRPRRLIAALAVAGLALTACGGGSDTAEPAASGGASGAAESDVRVGLAYDVGGRGDRSFNDSAAAGLDRAKKELGVEAEELSPNASGSDRGDNLRQLAEDGFNPIIAVGFAYAESLKTVVGRLPRHHVPHRRRLLRAGAERQGAAVRRGAGLLPRRRGRRAQEHDAAASATSAASRPRC